MYSYIIIIIIYYYVAMSYVIDHNQWIIKHKAKLYSVIIYESYARGNCKNAFTTNAHHMYLKCVQYVKCISQTNKVL